MRANFSLYTVLTYSLNLHPQLVSSRNLWDAQSRPGMGWEGNLSLRPGDDSYPPQSYMIKLKVKNNNESKTQSM